MQVRGWGKVYERPKTIEPLAADLRKPVEGSDFLRVICGAKTGIL